MVGSHGFFAISDERIFYLWVAFCLFFLLICLSYWVTNDLFDSAVINGPLCGVNLLDVKLKK